ncbi:MAG: signal peptidase I [Bacteroidales bacterium]|nr:signal peptidase I [Bacteroidales bacterium]
MLELLIFLPLSFTVPTIFLWVQFFRAGRKSWETLIPFYNLYVFLKIVKKPWWWYLLLLFPFINVFVYMLMLVEMAKCYGKYGLGEQFLAVVFPFIYFPYIATKNDTYLDPETREEPLKSATREWVDAIVFAVVAATIIRTFLIEAYTIPTSSMEKSLLVGDYLFVSKIAYGPKIPNTPLSFPFVHNTMPFTKDVNSYLDWIEFPYLRLPGLGHVKRNDVVVFNYPVGDTVSTRFQSNASYYALVRQYGRTRVWSDKADFGKIIYRPVDKEENFVKRCVGVAGDSLQIVNKKVYINGQRNHDPGIKEYEYYITTNGQQINPIVLSNLGVTEFWRTNVAGQYIGMLSEKAKNAIAQLPIVKSVVVSDIAAGVADEDIFPHDTTQYKWNRDNFGPIYIPKKGATIALNLKVLPLYRRIIRVYEGNKLEVKDGKIYINGKEADHYTFKMNYYWMMGDNRDNSADSRYWGFVPENHVEGKAVFIWLSLDPNKSLLDGKIRWNRLFTLVKN